MPFWAYACFPAFCLLAAPPAESDGERYEFMQKQMGVPFSITLYAPSEEAANDAARAAFARIKELNGILSDYEPESEMMRLCRNSGPGKPIKVSDDLWEILTRAQQLSRETQGAFDVTVGPVVRLWRKARRQKQLPPAVEIEAARALVDYRNVKLDEDAHTVELLKAGMQLDFGGIAKGYAADEALAVLRQRGLTRALVAGSGDIAVGDPPPGQPVWRVGIAPLGDTAPPSEFIGLKNAAVSTSGDAWQFVEIGGRRYSHIVDPRTGIGLTDRSSVTVVAPNDTAADALATAVSVQGPEAGIRLIEQMPGAAALIVRAPVGKPEVFRSERLKSFLLETVPQE
jgi:thiamine biosynthesis lipoprotein